MSMTNVHIGLKNNISIKILPVFGSIIAVLLVFVVIISDYELQALSLFIVTFLLIVIPFKIEIKRELYNPIFLFSIFFFIVFGVSVFSVLYFDPSLSEQSKSNYLIPSQLYAILSFGMFLLGYYYFYKRKLFLSIFSLIKNVLPKLNSYDFDKEKYFSFIITLSILGWISRAILFSQGLYFHTFDTGETEVTGSFALIRMPVTILSYLPLVIIVVALYESIKYHKKNFTLLFLFSFLAELAYGLPSGSKEKLLIPVAYVVVAYSMFKRTPRIFLLVGAIIGVFVVFPFSIFYKNLSEPDILLAFYGYIDFFQNFDPYILEDIFVTVFGVRLNYLVVLMSIQEYLTKSYEFLYGATYLDFFSLLIPRLIWPDKPFIYDFNKFAREFGFVHPTDFITSVTPTWVGEPFLNFGWFGIIIPLFIGVLFKHIYLFFYGGNYKPNVLFSFIYVYLFYQMLRIDILTAQSVGILQFLLMTTILFIPFLKKVKKTDSA